jgi:putative transposase
LFDWQKNGFRDARRRDGRKRALGTRAPLALPQGPNQRWSLDSVSDTLTDSRRFRMLVVVDDFARECVALVADTSLSGLRGVRVLRSQSPDSIG